MPLSVSLSQGNSRTVRVYSTTAVIPEVLHRLGDGVPVEAHRDAPLWLTRDADVEKHPVRHLYNITTSEHLIITSQDHILTARKT